MHKKLKHNSTHQTVWLHQIRTIQVVQHVPEVVLEDVPEEEGVHVSEALHPNLEEPAEGMVHHEAEVQGVFEVEVAAEVVVVVELLVSLQVKHITCVVMDDLVAALVEDLAEVVEVEVVVGEV